MIADWKLTDACPSRREDRIGECRRERRDARFANAARRHVEVLANEMDVNLAWSTASGACHDALPITNAGTEATLPASGGASATATAAGSGTEITVPLAGFNAAEDDEPRPSMRRALCHAAKRT